MKKVLFGVLFSFLFAFAVSAQDKAHLPAFKFLDTQGEVLTPDKLDPSKAVIVFYFDPDCDHCAQQATWITESIESFKNIQLIWVSWGEMDAIKWFKDKYFKEHADFPIFFTKDDEYKIDDWFGESYVPSVYVYNTGWNRVASLKKETEVAEILSTLR